MKITQLNDADTPEQMREAIKSARRDDALIHNCMTHADIQRMSAEDRYTVLAYQALVVLAKIKQERLEEAMQRKPQLPPLEDVRHSGA